MSFQYKIRGEQFLQFERQSQDYIEQRDQDLELYIATIDTSVALKANIASPTFTGTPTLPTGTIATTQTAGNNTTAVATTAFVNRLPFGVVDRNSDASNYNLTTTLTVVPGLTVAWTADSTRLYKITWYEPQCRTSTVASYINLQLRQTNAAGTQLQSTFVQNETAVSTTTGQTVIFFGTFASGSVTVVPCALTSDLTGTPRLVHSGTTRAFIIVEDVGLA